MRLNSFFIAVAIYLVGCGPSLPPAPAVLDTNGASHTDAKSTASSVNNFGFDLYQQLYKRDENLIFSPYSISMALQMAYDGADGETAKEMHNALHLDEETLRSRGVPALQNAINKRYPEFELYSPNSLWLQKDFPFKQTYLDQTHKRYSAQLEKCDFSGQPENERDRINQWVSESTHGMIEDLIPKGGLDSANVAVLVNAVYFNGKWSFPFDSETTHDALFTLGDGNQVSVPMMRSQEVGAIANISEKADEPDTIELTYKGDRLAMLLVKPSAGQFESFEHNLTAESLAKLREKQQYGTGMVIIPRFKFDSRFDLIPPLKNLGMKLAYDEKKSNFTKVSDKPIWINQIRHAARVIVNEEGTKAAAATEVGAKAASALDPSHAFIADRPFLFFILDQETGVILFMGRVVNPLR